jgi:hypothetical protein
MGTILGQILLPIGPSRPGQPRRVQLTPDAVPLGVVIGYGNVTPHAIDEAIALLATITH